MVTALCPCGSGAAYAECCEPFITGKGLPDTAEKLMRSRYTAYTKAKVDYIKDTVHPKMMRYHDESETRDWATNSEWQGLEIVGTDRGGASEDDGTVEFVARYRLKKTEEDVEHREVAEFSRHNGRWYFMDAKTVGPPPIMREAPKVGRNDPCACGSGKKHKKCCGR